MILDKIAVKTKERVEELKKIVPLEELKKQAEGLPVSDEFPFEKALAKEGITFICEVKKASPSKGLIAPDFPYVQIARDYEAAGAGCISCLTEPYFFQGSDEYLKEIVRNVSIPVLRKDFTVDTYMIYEAKLMGASAVLLICSILTEEQLKEYLDLAHSLGLSALVETHDEEEIAMALRVGARIIGVNNRDLKTFTVDIGNSARLRKLVPENILFVSESGIKTSEDVAALVENGTNAVLIGETLMRSENKREQLDELRSLVKKKTKIKLCGMCRLEDIENANRAMPDYVGFVFANTRRKISKEQAAEFRAHLDSRIKAVGVFVDADISQVIDLVQNRIIDIVQLHGSEDEAYIGKIKEICDIPVIKAVRIKTGEESETQESEHSEVLKATEKESEITGQMISEAAAQIAEAEKLPADFFIYDTFSKKLPGGTGKTFSWELLGHPQRPFFLAGGINLENVEEAIRYLHPYAIDVSSSVETDGIKDDEKMLAMVKAVRSVF